MFIGVASETAKPQNIETAASSLARPKIFQWHLAAGDLKLQYFVNAEVEETV